MIGYVPVHNGMSKNTNFKRISLLPGSYWPQFSEQLIFTTMGSLYNRVQP